MASYVSHNIRQLGPLLQISRTNDELGWTDDGGLSDTEIHYTNLFHKILFFLIFKSVISTLYYLLVINNKYFQ